MCGSVPISQDVIDNGINVATTDHIVFIDIYSDTNASDTTIAFAGPCVLSRRPVFSQLAYRSEEVISIFAGEGTGITNSNYDFHNVVVVTVTFR